MTNNQEKLLRGKLTKWLQSKGETPGDVERKTNAWLQYFDGIKKPVVALAACTWLCSGAVILPEDMPKVEDELVRRSMHELTAGEISGMKVQFFYNARNDAFVAMDSQGAFSLIYKGETGPGKVEFIVDGDFGGRLDQVKESLKVYWRSQHESLSNQRKQG